MIMASSPITSWQIDGERVEIVTYFILLGPKITADSDCSHDIERCLLLRESLGDSLVEQMVKCLPAMRETWVQSLGREDPLEKEMETHSSTLAWKIPWMVAWWATVHGVANSWS